MQSVRREAVDREASDPPSAERRRRLATGLLGAALALAAVFYLPADPFFFLILVVFTLAAREYAALARHWAPRAPLRSLLVWMPATALVLYLALRFELSPEPFGLWLTAAAALLALAAATPLFAGTPMEEAFPAAGALAFGVPYLAAPAVSVYVLKALDPWLLFALLAIVWLGDSAAYYGGSRFGRRRLAPVVSPKKTWEGAVAGWLAAVATAAVWSLLRLGELDGGFLAVAAVTAVAAQVGDLVESMLKRGAGVKDSSGILPGHGGFLDRLDALLLAAPVFLLGVRLTGLGS